MPHYVAEQDIIEVLRDGRRMLVARKGQTVPLPTVHRLGLDVDLSASAPSSAPVPTRSVQTERGTLAVQSPTSADLRAQREAQLRRMKRKIGPNGELVIDLSGTVLEDEEAVELPEAKKLDIDATDAARDLADEHGVDLSLVEGTGVDGRILVGDVEGFLSEEEE